VQRITQKTSTPPGEIRRLSVAVVLNGRYEKHGEKSVFVARSPDEVLAMAAIVKHAVGFNAERGDDVELRAVQFARLDTADDATAVDPLAKYRRYLPFAVAGLVGVPRHHVLDGPGEDVAVVGEPRVDAERPVRELVQHHTLRAVAARQRDGGAVLFFPVEGLQTAPLFWMVRGRKLRRYIPITGCKAKSSGWWKPRAQGTSVSGEGPTNSPGTTARYWRA